MSAAPTIRSLSVQDGAIQTRVFEGGSGQPIVYLHGAEGLVGGWSPFLAKLSQRYRVIAPEQPGFGESSGGERLNDILDLVVYHLDLLDALGLDRPHLIGHDLGGMVAAETAAVAGNRIGKLVLVGALGLWLKNNPVLDFYATPREELAAACWRDPTSPAATAVLEPSGTDDALQAAALERTRGMATSTRFLWPIPDRGLHRRLHRVNQPTLLVWGQHDRIVPPAYGLVFERAMPSAELVVLQDAAHMPMLEHPTRFCELTNSFLDRAG